MASWRRLQVREVLEDEQELALLLSEDAYWLQSHIFQMYSKNLICVTMGKVRSFLK